MAKNRKSKNARVAAATSNMNSMQKTLPSVPISQRPPAGSITMHDDDAHSILLGSGITSGTSASAMPSPDRRPPVPPSDPSSQHKSGSTSFSRDHTAEVEQSNGQHNTHTSTLSIPFILDDSSAQASPGMVSPGSVAKSRDAATSTQSMSRGSSDRKPSVRERRRPVDNELRLPLAQPTKLPVPAESLSHDLDLDQDPEHESAEQTTSNERFSLFPSKTAEVSRSPRISRGPATPNMGSEARGFAENIVTPSRRADQATPAVPPRSADRSTMLRPSALHTPLSASVTGVGTVKVESSMRNGGSNLSTPLRTKSSNNVQTTPPSTGYSVVDDAPFDQGRGNGTHSRNVSFSEIAQARAASITSTTPDSQTTAAHSTVRRHVPSKSLEGSPAYKFVPGSPVTLFENDLAKAFNLSPQGKRASQQSLNGASLERSGTISRLANKMLKHRKSVSGSALTPKSPVPVERQKSINDDASEVPALQAALRIRKERIDYLEHFIKGIDESKSLEQQLEERRSLLANVENQLLQSDAEHQSYLHHRHRISDVSVPLGEWKAGVVADMDSTLKKVKGTISQEIESLIRQRNDLQLENGKLLQNKSDLTQEVSILEQRRNNLSELHESMLRQIQHNMEAHKGTKTSGSSLRAEDSLTALSASPSFTTLELERNTNDTISETYLQTPVIGTYRKEYIEDEEDPVLEAATKRMSGERVPDVAAPKKFNLVKKTKKAFRWGRTPSSQDVTLGQYISGPTMSTGHSLSDMTMSSSKSSDKLVSKSGGGGKFKRTWQSQQNLSTQIDPRLDDASSTGQQGLFGHDLVTQSTAEGRPVPQIVTACIKVIEARALDFEGLYRKSGGAGEMKSLIESFEMSNAEGEAISVPTFTDISAITSVLKQYLRKLPIPLITFDNYEPFIGTSAIPSPAVRVRAVKDVLRDLPGPHYETLRVLFKHLQAVSRHCDKNLMTSKNLAVVLGPSIIWDPAGGKEILDMHDKNSCIQFCIDHAEEL
ncbi:Beta-chimaerin [Taphrina deformans PYCC 5710]|uniref:Beta-chimaerin n=1 Tax=Taphrina deformans (strain PYCC 5710 / ATCC 11124 / CBS 356.35 / IMI 108563 / JCM 9778 / NBRC 8474) TaxID=1097556 RepID=R4XBU8_TAPDE|nr:Beta-chimaerin [Taphrina deformans PYCC 5710]|eukprot:CCG83347.1 Beta-chimaerin [Taphrina deformans PYCC 5710]